MYVETLNNQNLIGSIVNTGEIWPNYPAKKVQLPEVFAVVTSGTTVSLLNRNIVISGGCNSGGGTVEIPFFGIQGPVDRINCQSAVKKKLRLTCYERPCAENTYMGVHIKRMLNPNYQHQGEWNVVLAFPESADVDCQKTCAQKVAEFVDYANAQPNIPVIFSVDGGNTSRMFIEARVAGEDFWLAGYEGFNTLTVVAENRSRVLYGDDLRGWGVEDCLAVGDCDPAICLNTIQFEAFFPNRHDSNDNVSTSSGNIGGSHYLMKKRVVIAYNAASTPTGITELLSIINGEKDPGDYIGVVLNAAYPAPTPTPTPV